MRILQICNKAPYPANDGSSIAIYNMAKGLYQNGAELHLLTINTKKHFKDDAGVPQEFKIKTHYRSVYKDTSPTAFGALLNLLLSSDSYFICRFYFKEFEDVLIETLQKNSFDLVQLEGLFMAPYIDTIRKYSKAKIALRAHNIEHLIWERHIVNEKSGLKKWYLTIQNTRLKKFEGDILKKVDTIITITDADKEFIQKQFKDVKVNTCITGVDMKEYEQIEGKTKEYTLFSFGSMDWMPNQEAVDWFINNCWKKINEKHPQCKFIIAGRHMPAKFRSLASPSVEIIENVSDNREFYSTFDIMLVPLLSGSGLRIKIIEGLAYGKAIVSTRIGAEGINVVNGQDLIIADTADEFASAIVRLLNAPSEKTKLQLNAKQFAKDHLENKQITKHLLDYYQNLN
jgi:glycosyltransferase involved in cell wall biosynthesis